MVKKAKLSIKRLDANINIVYDSPISYTVVSLSHILANAKFAAFTVNQTHTAKVKAAT